MTLKLQIVNIFIHNRCCLCSLAGLFDAGCVFFPSAADSDHAIDIDLATAQKSLTGWAFRRPALLTPKDLEKTPWPLK